MEIIPECLLKAFSLNQTELLLQLSQPSSLPVVLRGVPHFIRATNVLCHWQIEVKSLWLAEDVGGQGVGGRIAAQK